MATVDKSTHVRMLSDAQVNHYKSLMAQRNLINAEIQRFAQYLSEEYDISGDGWTLYQDRFERGSVEGTGPSP